LNRIKFINKVIFYLSILKMGSTMAFNGPYLIFPWCFDEPPKEPTKEENDKTAEAKVQKMDRNSTMELALRTPLRKNYRSRYRRKRYY
jgi:hypothetical protein